MRILITSINRYKTAVVIHVIDIRRRKEIYFQFKDGWHPLDIIAVGKGRKKVVVNVTTDNQISYNIYTNESKIIKNS